MLKRVSIAILSTAAIACGGGNNSTTPQTSDTVSINDYPNLTKAGIEAKILEPATASSLERHLKNGLRLNVNIRSMGDVGGAFDEAVANASSVDTTTLSSASNSEFSSTNTHILGVDESDFVKYDGRYIYMVTHPEYIWNQERPNAKIRILQTDPGNADAQEIGEIKIANEQDQKQWGEVSELYLVGDNTSTNTLVTLRSTWSFASAAEPTFTDNIFTTSFFAPQANQVQLASYNVEDPSQAVQDFTVEIDGYLQASRKIGNTLYLVTQYSPYLPFLKYFVEDETEAEENEARIANISLRDLLPSIKINNGEAQPLLNAEDCLVPENLNNNHGFLNIVSLIAIDLDNNNVSSVKCLNTQVDGIYSNANSLYLGGSSYNASTGGLTVIHKFNLEDNINYRSTGIVSGTFDWRDPSFHMDEYDNHLRVVTTSRPNNQEIKHQLTVLRDSPNSDEMLEVSSLPNEQNPAAIGKPNERIFAVRFMGERAYIVTFEQIDPLYALDLSDPDNPAIAGELEVPGFSTYLHPIDNNYLIGIGRETNEQGVRQGLKVSLYDVQDISSPSLLGSEVISGSRTWSSALFDLRAISFLSPSPDQLRFAFPISRYDEQGQWQDEALHLFQINDLTGNNATLSTNGKMVSETRSDSTLWPTFSGTDRSIMHDEAVYYTHGNGVWSGFWASPSSASGPH